LAVAARSDAGAFVAAAAVSEAAAVGDAAAATSVCAASSTGEFWGALSGKTGVSLYCTPVLFPLGKPSPSMYLGRLLFHGIGTALPVVSISGLRNKFPLPSIFVTCAEA
jgi:hypothetical protein